MKKRFSALFHFSFIFSLAALSLIVASLTGLYPATIALAQEVDISTITDDQVNAIAKQMFCPVCESTPLDVCPTQACAQWRELIREKLAAGWSEDEIKDYFVEQYGARVLAAPPAQGFNSLVYLVPPVAILVGVLILANALQSWKKPAAAARNMPPRNSVVQDEYAQQLEEELRKR